ncbi:MAG: hypothetical protein JKX97_02910, partial [Candidatus Lindowbacteria bacterium]|nr:hypothetical protein [Candidatus Lindowbacteria bacterium]
MTFTLPRSEFASSTTSTNNVIDTFSGVGYAWFDTTNGLLLKIMMDG